MKMQAENIPHYIDLARQVMNGLNLNQAKAVELSKVTEIHNGQAGIAVQYTDSIGNQSPGIIKFSSSDALKIASQSVERKARTELIGAVAGYDPLELASKPLQIIEVNGAQIAITPRSNISIDHQGREIRQQVTSVASLRKPDAIEMGDPITQTEINEIMIRATSKSVLPELLARQVLSFALSDESNEIPYIVMPNNPKEMMALAASEQMEPTTEKGRGQTLESVLASFDLDEADKGAIVTSVLLATKDLGKDFDEAGVSKEEIQALKPILDARREELTVAAVTINANQAKDKAQNINQDKNNSPTISR
ncbi:MAG: hypothetical protein ACJAS1_000855 [Oleiphilaceae bacterium]|jgi:hypothetical protein